MHFADFVALAAVLFTTLTENLRLCSSAEAGLFKMCTKWRVIRVMMHVI